MVAVALLLGWIFWLAWLHMMGRHELSCCMVWLQKMGCDGYMIWSPGGSSLIWLTNTQKIGLTSPVGALFFSEMASFFVFVFLVVGQVAASR